MIFFRIFCCPEFLLCTRSWYSFQVPQLLHHQGDLLHTCTCKASTICLQPTKISDQLVQQFLRFRERKNLREIIIITSTAWLYFYYVQVQRLPILDYLSNCSRYLNYDSCVGFLMSNNIDFDSSITSLTLVSTKLQNKVICRPF